MPNQHTLASSVLISLVGPPLTQLQPQGYQVLSALLRERGVVDRYVDLLCQHEPQKGKGSQNLGSGCVQEACAPPLHPLLLQPMTPCPTLQSLLSSNRTTGTA